MTGVCPMLLMQKTGLQAPVESPHKLQKVELASIWPLLPHAWVAGDDEMGRCSWCGGAVP